MAAASEGSGEIAVEEVGETVVEHAVLELAYLEVVIAFVALVDKPVAFEDAAVEVVDVEVGVVEDAACIETVEAGVDLVVDEPYE